MGGEFYCIYDILVLYIKIRYNFSVDYYNSYEDELICFLLDGLSDYDIELILQGIMDLGLVVVSVTDSGFFYFGTRYGWLVKLSCKLDGDKLYGLLDVNFGSCFSFP